MIKEVFKDIEGYEGLYQISNFGRVKSLSKTKGFSFKKETILKLNINRGGYEYVILSKNNERKTLTIHKLVASMFLFNPDNKPQVDHIDGNRKNNLVSNLRWCTAKENHNNPITIKRHSKASVGRKPSRKTIEKAKKILAKKVMCVELGLIFNSTREASKWLNKYKTSVSAAIFKNHKCGGYTWRYL